MNTRALAGIAGLAAFLALLAPANAITPPPPVHAEVTTAADPAPEAAVAPASPIALPPLPSGHVVHVNLVLRDTTVEIAPRMTYRAWTFNGSVPGPVIHAHVGDTVDVTLTNRAQMGHSIDFHAALAPANVAYQTIAPGQTLHFSWVAKYPGAFLYHCGTPPVLAHISNGMYGAIIVDPREQRSPAREFVIVQSEFYTAPVQGTPGLYEGSLAKMESGAADIVAFNGAASQYATKPVRIRVGEPVRVFVVNAGPSHFSAFHVVGTIFRKVYVDGNPANELRGLQTISIPPGGGAIVEFTTYQPGKYPFVTHAFGDADHGAIGIFQAE